MQTKEKEIRIGPKVLLIPIVRYETIEEAINDLRVSLARNLSAMMDADVLEETVEALEIEATTSASASD